MKTGWNQHEATEKKSNLANFNWQLGQEGSAFKTEANYILVFSQ